MFFNITNFGFYDPEDEPYYGEHWPDDSKLIEISDSDYETFSGSPPRGHKLGISDDGTLIWVEIPGQVAENNASIIDSLMAGATARIAPLQDAVDMNMATEEEAARLKTWKLYRIQLSRVDTSATNMELPTPPEE